MDSLSIVIPAYNEESRLPATLDRILAWVESGAMNVGEIIVVDDGSSDRTAAVAEEYTAIRVIRNPGNRGKGYAVRNGMLKAQGAWILYTDADLSAPIEEAAKLYSAAIAQDAAVAIGSRALDRSLVDVHQSAFREYSGRFFNVMMRLLTGLPFHDTQCGFKLYRADAAQAIFSRQQLDGFSFDVEDLYLASRLGLKTIEVPVHWSNVEGTKVSLRQGLKSFTDLARIRLRQPPH
ncbi:MAG: glycosyltransferase family 2 protein [Acidobacteriota bacterium]|nr:glycosyltransferase family 2 protein [Acidobacteriota bacterium]